MRTRHSAAFAASNVGTHELGSTLGRYENLRRQIVRLIFVIYWLLILEGALRKWGLPQLGQAFFFIRVPFTLVLYGLALGGGLWPRTNAPLLATYVLAVLALAIIPVQFMSGGYSSGHILIAAYGWINCFFYIPLAFLIAGNFHREDLHKLILHTLYLTLPAAVLVVLQFTSAPDSVMNVGSAEDEAYQFAGLGAALGFIRPTGFFTSTAGHTQFVASAAAMLLAVFLRPRKDRLLNPLLLWTGALAVIVMVIFSQSRTLFVLVGLIILSGVVAGSISRRGTINLRAVVWPTALVLVPLILWPLAFPTSYEVFMTRWTDAWRSEAGSFQLGIFGRALYWFYSWIEYVSDTPIHGYLVGIAGNAARQLDWVQMPQAAINWQGYGLWAEIGWERHIVELGPVLGLGFIVFRVMLTGWLGLRAFGATRRSGDPLPMLLFGYVGIVLLYDQITGHGSINGYAWMFSGFCLAAARITSSSKANRASLPTSSQR